MALNTYHMSEKIEFEPDPVEMFGYYVTDNGEGFSVSEFASAENRDEWEKLVADNIPCDRPDALAAVLALEISGRSDWDREAAGTMLNKHFRDIELPEEPDLYDELDKLR